MSTQTFLVELGTEELPPKALDTLGSAFQEQVQQGLEQAHLSFGKVHLYYAPRRLALKIENLQAQQDDQILERRGPAAQAAFDNDNQPTKALQGFLASCQATVEDITYLETPKGKWVQIIKQQPGQPAAALLPSIVEQALKKLPVPKMMRWGESDIEFVRPVHWLLMMLDQDVVQANLLGLQADRLTYGHRFHHPERLTLSHADHYPQILETQGHVIPCAKKRREKISHQIAEIEQSLGGETLVDPDLLREVANIVEWPNALLCRFDQTFLKVPKEALISSMQGHQKCFPVIDRGGQLEPYFITVSNIQSKRPQSVIEGNEKVMRARLSDAAFFYETDLKTPLPSRLPALAKVTFQAKLGSMADKSRRVMLLARWIAEQMQADANLAERAGELAKCDLMCDMVMEFPEVQGIMGEYYARHHNEPVEVAQALREQYHPRFAGDSLPKSKTGLALSLADKLDTLVGIFGIGQKPTGTKDPFALRRATIGILRMLIEAKLPVDLKALIEKTAEQFDANTLANKDVINEVLSFALERLRYYYQDQGVSFEMIDAVMAKNITHLADFDARIVAIQAFCQLPEATSLAAANKRVSNILQKETPKADLSEALLSEPAEQALAQALKAIQPKVESLFQQQHYQDALTALAQLKAPIDAFFDNVMVMAEDEDLKQNRLALLSQLQAVLGSVADIGRL